jgi:hypothetical protein
VLLGRRRVAGDELDLARDKRGTQRVLEFRAKLGHHPQAACCR